MRLFTLALAVTITAYAQNYTLQTVAGHNLSQENVPATQNYLRSPNGVAIDSLGNTYFSDTGDNRVWKIDTTGKATTYAGTGVPYYNPKPPQGVITTVAGNGSSTSSGDNSPATSAGMFPFRTPDLMEFGVIPDCDAGTFLWGGQSWPRAGFLSGSADEVGRFGLGAFSSAFLKHPVKIRSSETALSQTPWSARAVFRQSRLSLARPTVQI